ISFALTDRPPDAVLLEAAERGSLVSREDVRCQFERLLYDPQIEKSRILRFFQEYFGYTAATLVFKDKPLLSYPSQLIDDTDRLVLHVLENDQNVLAELLTTNRVFVQFDAQKAYGLDYKRRDGRSKPPITTYDWAAQPQPFTLPAEERAGILTQP